MTQLTWILYGGTAGAAVFSLLALLIYVGIKILAPQELHTSWREFPITFFLTVSAGFVIGGFFGNKMMPLDSTDRTWLIIDLLVCMTLTIITELILIKVWPRPEPSKEFFKSVMWGIISVIPASIYYNFFGHVSI